MTERLWNHIQRKLRRSMLNINDLKALAAYCTATRAFILTLDLNTNLTLILTSMLRVQFNQAIQLNQQYFLTALPFAHVLNLLSD